MSWLTRYADWTFPHESPSIFHLWAGMSVISAVLGRRSWINKGFYRLYPNLFVVLVAGSASCRKSTCIEMAAALLEDGSDLGIRIVEGKTSTEKFIHAHVIEEKEKQLSTFVKADELSVFLTRDQQGDRLIDVLTKLFDCPKEFSYDTFKHGKKVVREPYVTILAGTQPHSLERVLPDSAFGGGFTSRILFVYQQDTEKQRRDFQILTPEEEEELRNLMKDLNQISKFEGAFTLSAEAMEAYMSWYDMVELPEDQRIDGFVSRKHDHVLRTSMLLRAAMMEDQVIHIQQINASIAVIESIENRLPFAFAGVGSKQEIKSLSDHILRLLMRHKAIAHSELLRRCYGLADAKVFAHMMDTLIQQGLVTRDPECPRIYMYSGPRDFKV